MIDLKEINHHSADEKLKWWGYGEWVEEPDKILFKYRNYECVIVRMFALQYNGSMYGGHLCGYVQVPEDHPYFGKDYNDCDIDVHGGLTYSEKDEYNYLYLTHIGHWIGFDCAHCDDYCPSCEIFKRNDPEMIKITQDFEELYKQMGIESRLFNKTYKNVSFCIEQCKSMVDQLIKIEKSPSQQILEVENAED